MICSRELKSMSGCISKIYCTTVLDFFFRREIPKASQQSVTVHWGKTADTGEFHLEEGGKGTRGVLLMYVQSNSDNLPLVFFKYSSFSFNRQLLCLNLL